MRRVLGGDQLASWHAQVLSARAKRLRPAFLLLCARFGRRRPLAMLRRTAAALELVHEATLYHDDVVDLAHERRGEPTVWHLHGERVAALAGSELLYVAAELGASLPVAARTAIARAAGRLADGQGRELELVGHRAGGTLARWRVMARKTGSLFVLGAELGADLSAATLADRRRLVRFAHRFGLCYQLADDFLDLFADPASLGREPGADLRDGVYTLPLLAVGADDDFAALLATERIPEHAEKVAASAWQRQAYIEDLRGDQAVRRLATRLSGWLVRMPELLPHATTAAADRARHSLGALCQSLATRVDAAIARGGTASDAANDAQAQRTDAGSCSCSEAAEEGRA